MEAVTIVYHYEDGSWWCEAPSVPEFVAGGDTFDEARALAREGLPFTLDREVELDERFDDAALSARRVVTNFHVTGEGAASPVIPLASASTGATTAATPPRNAELHHPPASLPKLISSVAS